MERGQWEKMDESLESIKRRNATRKKLKATIDPNSFPHEIKRICKDCKEEKLCKWSSSFTTKGVPEYRTQCGPCFKIYLKKIRGTAKYRTTRNATRKRTVVTRKQWAVDFLGGKCKLCNYKKSLHALTFHHRNPEEKEYEVGGILEWDKNKIKKELNKCDLLCFNCHMELHEEIGRR